MNFNRKRVVIIKSRSSALTPFDIPGTHKQTIGETKEALLSLDSGTGK
jgi:hypothetical protein